MKKLSFRLLAAALTFIVGIFVTSLLIFNDFSKLRQTDVEPLDVSVNESKEAVNELSRLSNEDINYAVYSAVLAGIQNSSQNVTIVLENNFSANPSNFSKRFDSLTKEVVNDFLEKNRKSEGLDNNLTFNGKTGFFTEKGEKLLFHSADGWNSLNNRYPYAEGLFIFSDIGFNKWRTTAFVRMQYGNTSLVTGINYFILQKTGDTWFVSKKIGFVFFAPA